MKCATGSFWPILLKKSIMVCAAQKYASEIEIFTFGRGFRTEISRSSVQKRRLNQSMTRLSGRTDFFNRIGRLQSVAKGSIRTRFTTSANGELFVLPTKLM
ncbi:hypothetical protein DOZ80_21390 [Pseudomonas fluorescens]|uniref:Uncharacterized protein n=1 Tax=Pseudomonas fluorescens TaxID=294 RepID=A0A327MVJ6_PSEFL|nr:hypothetical protein DOZ80_21390 [Pseudomonas fluorescens]